MSDSVALVVAVVLLLANAFFVGAEFALISARRSTIEPRAREGSRRALTTLHAMERVSVMMAGAQLGITICSLGLGSIAEPAVAHLIERPFESLGLPEPLLHPLAFTIALSIVVFLHVVVGEMVPKNLALAGPDRAALLLAPPLVLTVRILRPVIAVLNAVANLTLRTVGVQPKDEITSAYTRDEVAGLVAQSRREGLLDAQEHELLSGALSFDEGTARTVLLSDAHLETVPTGVTPREVERVAAASGYSRFPVRDPDAGRLVGYLHLKDVLAAEAAERDQPVAQRWIRPLASVAAEDNLRAVVATMQRSGAHLARVLDGAGQEMGVVALEDVLEELVGEIRDEGQRVARRR